MEQRDSDFRIKEENFEAALAAIKKLANTVDRDGSGSSMGERWYAWVTTDEFLNAKTLAEAIRAWRWDVYMDDAGIAEIAFSGEKLGDDKIFLDAIAPWVEAGSFIEMSGEDGSLWRWVFNGETCQEKAGKIVWAE